MPEGVHISEKIIKIVERFMSECSYHPASLKLRTFVFYSQEKNCTSISPHSRNLHWILIFPSLCRIYCSHCPHSKSNICFLFATISSATVCFGSFITFWHRNTHALFRLNPHHNCWPGIIFKIWQVSKRQKWKEST